MIQKNNSISFIVPCYNEEKNIKNTITEICLAINDSPIQKYEIIIIDDGSKDNTYLIAKSLIKINLLNILSHINFFIKRG